MQNGQHRESCNLWQFAFLKVSRYFYFASCRGVKYCNQCVCQFTIILTNKTSKLQQTVSAYCLWPRLNPPLVALQYIQFCGWCHVQPIRSDVKRMYAENDSSKASTVGKVRYLQLPCKNVLPVLLQSKTSGSVERLAWDECFQAMNKRQSIKFVVSK